MIGLSGLITPSLDEMVHVAQEMERQGFDAAAADRRRHHEPRAHRGEDRARVPRSRPCTCSTRRARSAWSRACSIRRGSAPSSIDDEPRASRSALRDAAQREGGAAARAAAQPRTRARPRSSGDAERRRRARVRRPRRCWTTSRSPSWSRYIDWSVLLHGVGAAGPVPRDPRRSRGTARRRASCTTTATRLLDEHRRREAADARAASTASGRRRATATTSCCIADEARDRGAGCASRCCASRARKGNDGAVSRRLADFVAPVDERRVATTSARSRSPPGSAPTTLVAPVRGASTTTTTRSWSRRSPIASPRRSPRCCTSARGATGATAPTSASTPTS